jgi:feruloyl esterase
MSQKRTQSPACIGIAGVIAAAALAACGSDDNPDTPPPTPTVAAPSSATCAALAAKAVAGGSFPANVVVTTAALVPAVAASGATPATPEHCNVTGTMDARTGAESSPGVTQTYAIKWQVRLPTGWNGRFAMQGGGGLNGSVPNTLTRLREGYATAANDSGHDNTVNNDPLAAATGAFATDYEARTNFAYRAIEKTNQLARALMTAYYPQSLQYSYFEGCSMGGREAMMVTQRLPQAFSGVVSGDPGFKLVTMSTHEVYNAQLLAQLATRMGLVSANGVPLASNTYTNQDLQIVSKAVLDACDGLDGLQDGMVNKPLQCTTTRVRPYLDAKRCSGTKDATCLSADQIDTLVKLYEGVVTPSGARPYYGWMWDAGIAGCTSAADCNTPSATNIATNWRSWKIGSYQADLSTAQNNALDFTGGAGGALSTVLAPTPPTLPAPVAAEGLTKIMLDYDLDAYYASLFATNAKFPVSSYDQLQADSTDLSAFKTAGGKLIVWQPQSGGPFSPLAMVDWYDKLNVANGGNPFDYGRTQQFARLFMMPGAHHCGGGPSTSNINAFASVVDWVEKGTAPAQIVGTAPATTPWPGRTRPLCPYPKTTQYKGSGSIEDAANFTCS